MKIITQITKRHALINNILIQVSGCKELIEGGIDRENNVFAKIMKNIDTEQKAIGGILLEEFKECFKIYPIVWVKTIDTLYYETACGSGSLAVTIYKNYITNKSNFEIL